jgi:RHS repeat-associated protein
LWRQVELGRTSSATDKLGHVTSFVYDSLSRQVGVIRTDGKQTTNQYDLAGQLMASTDANGNTTDYQYDDAGHQTQVIDALGHTTTYEYKAAGWKTSMTDANTNVTHFWYDDVGNLTNTTFSDNTTRITQYDLLGQKVVEIDQAGNTNLFGYDALGRLIAVTNALGKITTYGYDEIGNQTNQVDALGRQTKFEYDALGRRTKRTLPGGQYETFAYDAAGNQISHTDFNGLTVTNAFDSMNRFLGKWIGSTQLEAYHYDSAGQLTNRTDTSGSYTWVFDKLGRVTTNSTPVGTLYYGYDANGNQTNLSSATSNGVLIAYQYDALNRLTNVLDSRLPGSQITAYAFDGVGNLASLRYPNGVTNQYRYDSLNRLTNLVWKLNSTTLASFAYQLGPTGNRTNLQEIVGTATTVSRTNAWLCDTTYRLTNEIIGASSGPSGNLSYALDDVGNRNNRSGIGSLTNNLGPQSPSYGSNDWLSSDGYDSNGNTTNSGSIAYQYDYANRLTNAGSGSAVITYGADGNRIKKVTATSTNLYLVAAINPTGYPQVVEELAVSGSTTNLGKVYTYGLALISQRQPGGSTNFFGADGHGSTRLLIDIGGIVTNTFAYDAYGTLIASNSTPQTAYLYCGEQFDADLGFYYLRARFMNTGTGRFWSVDTFEGDTQDPITLHEYLYGNCDPVDHLDPTGHGDFIQIISVVSLQVTLTTLRWSATHPKTTFLLLSALASTGVFDGFPPGEPGPVGEMQAYGQFLRGATASAEEAVIIRRYQSALFNGTFFSKFSLKTYTSVFFKAFPKLDGQVVVHHAIEQQVQKLYPGVINEFEMNSLGNLRGIPKDINPDVHLRQIRKLWDVFYKSHQSGATKTELLGYAKKIDDKFGSQFNPPTR